MTASRELVLDLRPDGEPCADAPVAATASSGDRAGAGRRSSGEAAPDGAVTTVELIINMVITGLLLASIGAVISLSARVFGADENASDPPQRVVQRELSRTAERMLVVDDCESPDDKKAYSECLELAEVPFPATISKPSWSGYPADDVLCWMAESPEGLRSTSVTDTRIAECWYHDADNATLMAAAHRSSGTRDDFEPSSWDTSPYSVRRIATRVERLGYCETDSLYLPVNSDDDSGCTGTGETWNAAWECVKGIDTDRESGVSAQLADPGYTTDDCSTAGETAVPTTATQNNDYFGVAVLRLRMCVSMSPAELRRRTNEERWHNPPVTCEARDVTVTPGRKSL